MHTGGRGGLLQRQPVCPRRLGVCTPSAAPRPTSCPCMPSAFGGMHTIRCATSDKLSLYALGVWGVCTPASEGHAAGRTCMPSAFGGYAHQPHELYVMMQPCMPSAFGGYAHPPPIREGDVVACMPSAFGGYAHRWGRSRRCGSACMPSAFGGYAHPAPRGGGAGQACMPSAFGGYAHLIRSAYSCPCEGFLLHRAGSDLRTRWSRGVRCSP